MDARTIEQLLTSFINDELLVNRDSEPLKTDSPLMVSGALDSLAVMRLVMFIEAELGVKIPITDITQENFLSIERLTGYLSGIVSPRVAS